MKWLRTMIVLVVLMIGTSCATTPMGIAKDIFMPETPGLSVDTQVAGKRNTAVDNEDSRETELTVEDNASATVNQQKVTTNNNAVSPDSVWASTLERVMLGLICAFAVVYVIKLLVESPGKHNK